MASVLTCAGVLCPATTTAAARRTRNSGSKCDLLCTVSVSEGRSRSFGMVGDVQHFGLWGRSFSKSRCSSELPMNARKPAVSRIWSESGETDGAKLTKQRQRESDAKLFFPSEDPIQDDHPLWSILQRGMVCVLLIIVGCSFLPNAANAVAVNSIGASSLGLKVAEFLRRFGLPDELVVLTVATLPVVELRGAIPVSYWLKLEPVKGFVLAVIGNMIPVPFIVLYLEKMLKYIGEKSETGQKFVRWIFERTRKKAGPIEEFEWLGLMLFVAVPFPGTGAWTGAIAASILGMPFWDAITANFLGVALAGLLVNLIVRVGAKEAFLVGIAIMVSSLSMWKVLRVIQPKKST